MKRTVIGVAAAVFSVFASFSAWAGEWKTDEKGWQYIKNDGTYASDILLNINGEYYGFDDEGYMITGWYEGSKGWRYFHENGVCASTEWIDGQYYIDGDGIMLTDADTPDGHHVGEDGRRSDLRINTPSVQLSEGYYGYYEIWGWGNHYRSLETDQPDFTIQISDFNPSGSFKLSYFKTDQKTSNSELDSHPFHEAIFKYAYTDYDGEEIIDCYEFKYKPLKNYGEDVIRVKFSNKGEVPWLRVSGSGSTTREKYENSVDRRILEGFYYCYSSEAPYQGEYVHSIPVTFYSIIK